MLSGCAIVATGVGSICDALQDGETGLVVPVDNANALADALRRLKDDPGLRLRLGAAAAESAHRRSWIGTSSWACARFGGSGGLRWEGSTHGWRTPLIGSSGSG